METHLEKCKETVFFNDVSATAKCLTLKLSTLRRIGSQFLKELQHISVEKAKFLFQKGHL